MSGGGEGVHSKVRELIYEVFLELAGKSRDL